MDRLASMEVFVKVAETGSSDALGISGAMVGKHIRMLEEHLGVQLLHRTTRRQSLTGAGKDSSSARASCWRSSRPRKRSPPRAGQGLAESCA